MNKLAALSICLIALFVSAAGHAYYRPATPGDVDVRVVLDNGRELPLHALDGYRHPEQFRAYLEAVDGAGYSLRVRNRTGGRVGVVMTVDGRNIISGKRSELAPSEPMYVLGPYQSQLIRGWRTSSQTVNRFYFTDSGDSYAGAWGDYSAMGVIAVAVYREKAHYRPPQQYRKDSPKSEIEPRGPTARHHSSEPGTGYGGEVYSGAVEVRFRAEKHATARYFLKYEWRETLCELGVVRCGRPGNRFWPDRDMGFVAPPPMYHQPWRR